MRSKGASSAIAALVVCGLATASVACRGWEKQGILDDTAAFGFPRALEYAERASAAYESDDVIRQRFGQSSEVTIRDLPGLNVKAFVEIDRAKRLQWVVVRGTANLANVRVDCEYHRDSESHLGCPVHRGFYTSAIGVYAFARPLLDPTFETRVTGHSLGGAVAAVLLMMFENDGLKLGRAMTFGQPKVTDEQGVLRYARLPLLRFVNHDDPIPLIPPAGFLPREGRGGAYRHFGAEVWLEDNGEFEFFSEHRAQARDLTSFWGHLGEENPAEHLIAHYISKMEALLAKFPHRAPLETARRGPA
jgi:triacylglycerol lipase